MASDAEIARMTRESILELQAVLDRQRARHVTTPEDGIRQRRLVEALEHAIKVMGDAAA